MYKKRYLNLVYSFYFHLKKVLEFKIWNSNTVKIEPFDFPRLNICIKKTQSNPTQIKLNNNQPIKQKLKQEKQLAFYGYSN